MSIPVLIECSSELRRLSIAGSKFAKDDYRIKRLVDALEESGKKAPVFKKVADTLGALADTDAEQSGEKLLAAATLVNAILYTQGETGGKGDMTPVPSAEVPVVVKNVVSKALKPVIEALNTTGSGRWEIVTDAFQRGLFEDFRLLKPAMNGLGDPYGELADFMAEKVLPSFGAPVLPFLKKDFDIKGKKIDGRRLSVITEIEGEKARDLCLKALEEGSKDVRIAALSALKNVPGTLPQILERCKDKNSDVRCTAIAALAGHHEKEAIEVLLEALESTECYQAASVLAHVADGKTADRVLAIQRRRMAEFLNADEKDTPNHIQVCEAIFRVLNKSNPKGYSDALLQWFEDRDKFMEKKAPKGSYRSGEDLVRGVVEAMAEAGTEDALKAVVAGDLDERVLTVQVAIEAGRKLLNKDDFFEQFSKIYLRAEKQNKNSFGYQLCSQFRTSELSPKWFDFAVKYQLDDIVKFFASSRREDSIRYFQDRYKKAEYPSNRLNALENLIACKAPDLLPAIEKELLQTKAQMGGWHRMYSILHDLDDDLILALEKKASTFEDGVADHIINLASNIRAKK